MKRICCIPIAVILLITLTACSGGAHTLSPAYEGEIQATNRQNNYTAYLISDGETMCLSLSAPESVAGLRYEFRDGDLHTALNGLDCITDPDSLPSAALAATLYEVFRHTGDAEYTGSTDDGDAFTLKTERVKAAITAKDGEPLIVTIENGGWTISCR